MKKLISVGLLLTAAVAVSALDVPFLAGRVNDNAGILSPQVVAELETMLAAHEDSTSNQVAVLTIPSLEGEVLEEYSLKVAETWALGQADKDNGVLLLVARDDRKVRIEVGSGLEGDLTDAVSGRIIRNEIVPRFRDGDFDGGVRDGVVAILAAIDGAYEADDESDWADDDFAVRIVAGLVFTVVVGTFTMVAVGSSGFASWFLFVFLIPFWLSFPNWILGPTYGMIPFVVYFFGFILLKLWLARSGTGKNLAKKWGKSFSSGGGWSSGSGSFSSSSSSSFSGGGGSFSGGGSSGSW